ncbi:hypothetical protein C2845_PM12G11560 [Panicum miliaceum]|uniref:Late embryogenesis abundant protein LEA-2 subgroup domain-containing protein n=1 Tax=Panicum miliaceum TaxID=4540 RepID=A0A3L6QG08_PANMI|nr:hypothetical protein C2845_PM12G11560 [Panicum miliaceum]
MMGVFRAQAEPYDDERRRCCGCCRHIREQKCCWFFFVLWAVVGGLAIGTLAWFAHDAKEPRYSAAIASVSGLDPARDLGRATLDPEFNLTLRIASRSHTSGACVGVGAALDVSYRGVRLAGAPAPHLCARRMGAAETAAPVVAWGAAVRVPGFVLDGLAGDMRRGGGAAFDVTLTVPSVQGSRQGKLVRCLARRVGDAGALLDPCVVNDVDTAVAVPQPAA